MTSLDLDLHATPDHADGDFGDGLEHWFCGCLPDRALCGADLTGEIETEAVDSPDDCIVCVGLRDNPCDRCGA